MAKMDVKGAYAHLEFLIPARGLIGLRNRLMSATQGEAIMHHNFHDYRPIKGDVPTAGQRRDGQPGARARPSPSPSTTSSSAAPCSSSPATTSTRG